MTRWVHTYIDIHMCIHSMSSYSTQDDNDYVHVHIIIYYGITLKYQDDYIIIQCMHTCCTHVEVNTAHLLMISTPLGNEYSVRE